MQVNLEAGNLIVGSSDTTAIALTYLIWAVLKRPELQRALENEVPGVESGFNEINLEAQPLLKADTEETHRLYGAAPSSLPRMAPTGGTKLGGCFMSEGTTLCTQAYTIHRDASLFEEPDEYLSPVTPATRCLLTLA